MQDIKDIGKDVLFLESLELHVKLWMDAGMPDYANGRTVTYEQDKRAELNNAKVKEAVEKQEGLTYRKPFIPYAD